MFLPVAVVVGLYSCYGIVGSVGLGHLIIPGCSGGVGLQLGAITFELLNFGLHG